MAGLGAVRSAFFRRRCAAPAWGGWLKDPTKSGGGVFDLLIHDVDYVPPSVRQSGGASPPPVLRHGARPGPDCTVNCSIRFGPVVVPAGGSMTGPSRSAWNTASRVMAAPSNTVPPGARRRCTRETEQALELDTGDGYAAEIEYFVECCRANRQPRAVSSAGIGERGGADAHLIGIAREEREEDSLFHSRVK